MAGNAYAQKMDELYKIKDDAWKLYQVICQDADVTPNDWGYLGRICERLDSVHNVFSWNWCYPIMLARIEDEKIEDGKLGFLVNKEWDKVYNNRVVPTIKSLLDVSKQWKFNDYRIVNFQNDLREWTQGKYDLLTEDDSFQEHNEQE